MNGTDVFKPCVGMNEGESDSQSEFSDSDSDISSVIDNNNGATLTPPSSESETNDKTEAIVVPETLDLPDISNNNNSPKTTCIMADQNVSPSIAPQRKLPIPNPTANSISNNTLNGILIKPKRILPAQPDYSKVKRTGTDTSPQYKTHDSGNGTSQSGLNQAIGGVKNGNESSQKLSISIPKLNIDVDRLKTYFQTHKVDSDTHSPDGIKGKDIYIQKNSQSGKEKENVVENKGAESVEDIITPDRSQIRNVPSMFHTRESTLYNYSPEGLNKVREWCSPSEMNKMATDASVTKSLERGIRSPSPKGSTTWDRSSSGYSSDERQDPKSPIQMNSASSTLKADTDLADLDDGILINDKTIRVDENTNEVIIENNNNNSTNNNNESANCDSKTECCAHTNSDVTEKCEKCDASSVKTDGVSSEVQNKHFQIDNSIGNKQMTRKPAWSPLSNMPVIGGRIQYRKSGSESMISLRHPSRQGISDTKFDGLEVCGKSFQIATTPIPSGKLDSVTSEGAKTEIQNSVNRDTLNAGNRPETTATPSAFSSVEKHLTIPVLDLGRLHDNTSAIRSRVLGAPLASCRSPRDMKSLSLNAKLNPRDDKDIRKSLHDLNSPRRQSPGGKIAPIRARPMMAPMTSHSNQPMAAFDTTTTQPTSAGVTNSTKSVDNRQRGIFAGKKMWRAPSGQPENSPMRPFSPFGGTLPPSKIKEQEKMRHSPEMP